jgi:VanZ family protein
MRRRILGTLCIPTILGLLVLGLWPFHQPVNEVTWLKNADGLQFGSHGTVQSTGALEIVGPLDDNSCSFEIWLRTDTFNDPSTAFSFYDSQDQSQFVVRREDADLVMRRERPEGVFRTIKQEIEATELFHLKKSVLITVASGARGTALYADGLLVRTYPNFKLSRRDFAGQLVVGDSPVEPDSWVGQVLGLAFYTQELTADQVLRNEQGWTRSGRPEDVDSAAATYLFSERGGNVVHNASGKSGELTIPYRYSVIDKMFLETPWKAFQQTWNYWKDIANNIVGFVPLGFLAAAYFSLRSPNQWATRRAIVLGLTVSLTIETLQIFLPTRDSDLTDVMTNTLGTCLGVLLNRWKSAQQALNAVLEICESGMARLVA